jgi:hypothetical protein
MRIWFPTDRFPLMRLSDIWTVSRNLNFELKIWDLEVLRILNLQICGFKYLNFWVDSWTYTRMWIQKTYTTHVYNNNNTQTSNRQMHTYIHATQPSLDRWGMRIWFPTGHSQWMPWLDTWTVSRIWIVNWILSVYILDIYDIWILSGYTTHTWLLMRWHVCLLPVMWCEYFECKPFNLLDNCLIVWMFWSLIFKFESEWIECDDTGGKQLNSLFVWMTVWMFECLFECLFNCLNVWMFEQSCAGRVSRRRSGPCR